MKLSDSLKPTDFFSKCYCMVSYSFRNNKYEANKVNFWFVFRLTAVLIIATVCPIMNYVCYTEELSPLGHVPKIVKSVFHVVTVPIVAMIIPLAHLKRKQIINFLNSSVHLDATFKRLLGHNEDYRYLSRLQYAIVLLMPIEDVSYIYFLAKGYRGHSWDAIIAGGCLRVLTRKIFSIVLMQWINYQLILKNHIKLMNNYFETLSKQVIIDKRSMMEIAHISYKLYNTIAKQADNLNQAYGWQMLLIIPLTLIMLVSDAYYLTKLRTENLDLYVHVLIEVYWGTRFLLWSAIASSRTANESKKFSWILRNIDVTVQEDPLFQEIMNLLSMQAFHHKIRFSAVEVFSLDAALLTSIWVTLTTYLAILIQNY